MKRMSFLAVAALALGAAGPAWAQDSGYLSSNLFGENVPDGGGTDKASGDFNSEADPASGKLCYYMAVNDLDGAEGAAIHEGASGKTGPALLPLPLPADKNKEVCVTADKALLAAMIAKPADYYIAVNTPGHPDGAIRGQLD